MMVNKTTLEASQAILGFIIDGYNSGKRPTKDDWFNALNAAMRVQNDIQNQLLDG